MRVGTVSQLEESKGLRLAYDCAWRQWSVAVTTWQAIQDGAATNGVSVADAEITLRLTHSQYQRARNALAEFLLDSAYGRYLARPA